jgi:hypothetical protein
LSRYDADSSFQCPFEFEGTTAIDGAALLDGRLIIGRRSLSSLGCGDHFNPVTIEAYDLPGESLAPSGWVQSGGSPGLGMRPLRR